MLKWDLSDFRFHDIFQTLFSFISPVFPVKVFLGSFDSSATTVWGQRLWKELTPALVWFYSEGFWFDYID